MNRTISKLIRATRCFVPNAIKTKPFLVERVGKNVDVINIITLETFYPRIIHAEVLRSRRLSHSVASSRAIPTKKYIDNYANFVPRTIRKNEKGMSPSEFINPPYTRVDIKRVWNKAKEFAVRSAEEFALFNVSKEQTNRLLEPFSYVRDLVTGSEQAFDAFFKLRLDSSAQYEIRTLAKRMCDSIIDNKSYSFECHVPYNEVNREFKDAMLIATARSARTSYDSNSTGKLSTYEEDMTLYLKLITPAIPHLSPSEHVVISYPFFYEKVLPSYINYLTKMGKRFNPFETGCKIYGNSLNMLSEYIYDHRVEGNLEPGVIQLRRLVELSPTFSNFLVDRI